MAAYMFISTAKLTKEKNNTPEEDSLEVDEIHTMDIEVSEELERVREMCFMGLDQLSSEERESGI